jgi:hypothetical protein
MGLGARRSDKEELNFERLCVAHRVYRFDKK